MEFAKEGRTRREPYDREERSYAPRRRPVGFRIAVDNISRDTSWQDLKDFGREAGNVSFADIDRDVPGRGVLEYVSRDDADHAVKFLDGKDLRGQAVTVTLSEDRGGPDNFRREERRDDRGRDDALFSRDDRYRDDRYRDDRHRDDKYRDSRRRGRSDSPPRRDERARSPRRDEERRSGREEGGHERRQDERRRDDRETVRTEERPPRPSNGY